MYDVKRIRSNTHVLSGTSVPNKNPKPLRGIRSNKYSAIFYVPRSVPIRTEQTTIAENSGCAVNRLLRSRVHVHVTQITINVCVYVYIEYVCFGIYFSPQCEYR